MTCPSISDSSVVLKNKLPIYEDIFEGTTDKIEATIKILMPKYKLFHQVHRNGTSENLPSKSILPKPSAATNVELE